MRTSHFFLLLPQAFWIKPDNTDETAVEDLEIDEVKLTASDKSLLLLASTEIHRESESPERYNCPIWTMGLERTFKVRIHSIKFYYPNMCG